MRVSVVIATRNSARFLPETLASVGAQRGVEMEVIVVDGRSEDGTAAIAREFGAVVLTQPDDGLANAWNMGLARVSAPYVAILDSDDMLLPDTLLERVHAARDGVSMGKVRYFAEDGVVPSGLRPELFVEDQLAPIPGTLIVSKTAFDAVGPFDASYVIAADVDWIGRMIDAGFVPTPVDKLVLLKRIHGENLSMRTELNTTELLRALRAKVTSPRRSA